MIDLFSEQITKPYYVTDDISLYSLIKWPLSYLMGYMLITMMMMLFLNLTQKQKNLSQKQENLSQKQENLSQKQENLSQKQENLSQSWVEALEQCSKTDDFVLIGISGRKFHGKTTIGDYLEKKYGFIQLAFGDKVKKVCQIAFEFDDAQLYGNEKDKETVDQYWGHSPRELFQKVGTELFRNRLSELCENITDDIWIRAIDIKLQKLRASGYNKFVISDVRFPNEHMYIKKKAGDTWKVINPKKLIDNNHANSKPEHPSEALVDTLVCDVNLINDSSLDNLYQLIDDEMIKIK
jgi:hypothetical protein